VEMLGRGVGGLWCNPLDEMNINAVRAGGRNAVGAEHSGILRLAQLLHSIK